MPDEKKRFILIDSNSVIHRAYHALPPLSTKNGELVNAVYGFILVFFRAIKDFQPAYAAACFDFPAPTFRHQKFKEYKAKRPPAPKELYSQFPRVKEVLKVFGVPIFEKEGFESDDLIGTIAARAEKDAPEIETIILSGDRDCLQLISPRAKVYVLKSGVKNIILYDEDLFKNQYSGLSPTRFVDFKALKGDASDNIPGVRGIGEKTALKLLNEFGTLANIYKEIERDSAAKLQPKLKELLVNNKEQAFLSYHLAEIKKDVPVDFILEKCRWGEYDEKAAARHLESLDFYTLVKKLPELRAVNGRLKLW